MKNWFRPYYSTERDAIIMLEVDEDTDGHKIVLYLQFPNFNFKASLSKFEDETVALDFFNSLTDEIIKKFIDNIIAEIPYEIG